MTKSQIKILDRMWAVRVKSLAGYACEYCLETSDYVKIDGAHIIGRANRATRWDLDNGMALCFFHHRQYDTHGMLHNSIFKVVIGDKRMERLTEKAQAIAKGQDFETIKEGLK